MEGGGAKKVLINYRKSGDAIVLPCGAVSVLVFRINYNKHDGFLEKLNRGERQQDRLFMLRWSELHLNRRKVSIFFQGSIPNYQKHFISGSFRPEIKEFGTGNSRQRPPFILVPRQEISS